MPQEKHGDIEKVKCRCGRKVDQLYSYKDSNSGYRVTVCEFCGIEHGFEGNIQWQKIDYKQITEDFKKTPEPNAEPGN